jgi:leader peptidase (prepilin peptidase)/N-methyltransferase
VDFYFLVSLVVIGSLCWGSFLAASAYRIAFDKDFMRLRSHCTECDHVIAWYDNIPVISWIMLRGICRSCKKPISPQYPFIEISTMVIMVALFYKIFYAHFYHFSPTVSPLNVIHPILGFTVYGLFFSALILSTATDLNAMVIPQCATLWLIPVGIGAAYCHLISIAPGESIIGAVVGYGSLWLTATFFRWYAKKDGLGVGDMELLGMIGSFIGPLGIWIGLMIGSITGFIIGGAYLLIAGKDRSARIPFGPFLAFGALLFFFFKATFVKLLVS